MRLQLHGIEKKFGGTWALRGVNLQLEAGQLHALLGGAGAGKRTLLHIVSGALRPDGGFLLLDGKPFAPARPRAAREAGVTTVGRLPLLAGHLSVEENLTLGLEPASEGWIDLAQRTKVANEGLAQLHSEDIPLAIPAGALPLAHQQRVALARAFLARPKVLLLDEPASCLGRIDRQNLFSALRDLAAQGTAILYLTQSVEEPAGLCSRYTLLRKGEIVASGRMSAMEAGQAAVAPPPEHPLPHFYHRRGRPVLEIREPTEKTPRPGVNLALHQGEIFGLSGLAGAGGSSLLRAVSGLEAGRLRGRELLLDGRILKPSGAGAKPRRRVRAGIAMTEGGRKGLMLNRSVADNLTLGRIADFGMLGFFSRERQQMAARDWMEKLNIKAGTPCALAEELSLSHRRLVALGRLINSHARVLLLDEPTGGIDPAARAQIHKLLRELTAEGKSILIASSNRRELLALCDTIGVMRGGHVRVVRPVAQWTEASLIEAALNP